MSRRAVISLYADYADSCRKAFAAVSNYIFTFESIGTAPVFPAHSSYSAVVHVHIGTEVVTVTTFLLQWWSLVSRGPDWKYFMKLGEKPADFLIKAVSSSKVDCDTSVCKVIIDGVSS